MICLNLKAYKESIGPNADKIAAAVSKYVSENPGSESKFCVAPVSFQLSELCNKYQNTVFCAQHTDSIELGQTTGSLPVEALAALGVEYTILNHSEKRIMGADIVEKIKFIQAKGVKVIVCCENVAEAIQLLEAQPFAIAYETKELIGSGKSVSSENPEIVQEFVRLVKGKTKAYIGAGISTAEDVRKGIELGAEGFLLASAFVKAEDHYKKLAEFVEAFNL
jgi:triosephosphate isomerase